MPRLTIQQFRATLTATAGDGVMVRAYRELARRPELATGMRSIDWGAWPPALSPLPA